MTDKDAEAQIRELIRTETNLSGPRLYRLAADCAVRAGSAYSKRAFDDGCRYGEMRAVRGGRVSARIGELEDQLAALHPLHENDETGVG